MVAKNHIWNFSSVGGVKRVNLESGADLLHLDELDQKLWTALSCPVYGLEIDPKTLELIDTDNDGQIRIPEILNAVKWLLERIKNPDIVLNSSDVLELDEINEQTEQGKNLLTCAGIILRNLGKPDSKTISIADTADFKRIFAGTAFNGDGIITVVSSTDEQIKKLIEEIILCCGSSEDRSGSPGIKEAQINEFFDACNAYSNWQSYAENNREQVFPFAENTLLANELLHELEAKVDDYFLRCKLAAFHPDATKVLNALVDRMQLITDKDLSNCLDEISSYPLSHIEAGKPLQINSSINPAWENKWKQFKQLVLGNYEVLTEEHWHQIKEKFVPFQLWLEQKSGSKVEVLGIERVRDIIQSDADKKLNELILLDKDLEDEANSMIQVDQLLRYRRDLFTVLKNFVTFFDFYTPGTKAIFQAGTLYIDQRSCDLCIKVNDMGRHNEMVAVSGMFLIYCDCYSKTSNEKMTIVAALTNGDIDNLMVGRNAVFYDRKGVDWDASIVKIVDNPISIRQAFFTPYRKLSAFVNKQINKMASSQDEKVDAAAASVAENNLANLETASQATQPKAPEPVDVGKYVGIFAAIALALGAIGTAVASIVAGFMSLSWWQMPLAIAGILLLISGPSMVIAYLKLRTRNLAPLLDANGWAINARAVVNIQFGKALTQLAELPPNSKVNLNDPFTKKKRPVLTIFIGLIVVALLVLYLLWKFGFMVL
ncbi:MAG: hypothetical protein ACOVP1_04015 [Bacteroidia bacterium]